MRNRTSKAEFDCKKAVVCAGQHRPDLLIERTRLRQAAAMTKAESQQTQVVLHRAWSTRECHAIARRPWKVRRRERVARAARCSRADARRERRAESPYRFQAQCPPACSRCQWPTTTVPRKDEVADRHQDRKSSWQEPESPRAGARAHWQPAPDKPAKESTSPTTSAR